MNRSEKKPISPLEKQVSNLQKQFQKIETVDELFDTRAERLVSSMRSLMRTLVPNGNQHLALNFPKTEAQFRSSEPKETVPLALSSLIFNVNRALEIKDPLSKRARIENASNLMDLLVSDIPLYPQRDRMN